MRVATSVLGSEADAEDVVQETWLRLRRVDRSKIRSLGAWLRAVVVNVAVDARTARPGGHPWDQAGVWELERDASDPDQLVIQREDVEAALAILLRTLSPPERSAFVLHDLFGLSFVEVAAMVGRKPSACRQLAVRAREHIAWGKARFPVDAGQLRRVAGAFSAACEGGDLRALQEALEGRPR